MVVGKSKVMTRCWIIWKRFDHLGCRCRDYGQIIERIEERVQRDKYMGVDELNRVLERGDRRFVEREYIVNDAASFELPENGVPYVIMVVGGMEWGKRLRSESWPINLKEAGKSGIGSCRYLFVLLLSITIGDLGQTGRSADCKTGNGCRSRFVAYDTLGKAKADGADVVIYRHQPDGCIIKINSDE